MIKVGAIYKKLAFNIQFAFARQRKNSQWIYSSLSEKMAHAKLPSITIFAAPPSSTFDLTLRIKKALQGAHILLSNNPIQTHHFLNSIPNSQEGEKSQQTSSIIISQKDNSELAKWQNKGVQLEWSLELSKQLQLAIQNQKIMQSNNDRQNKKLKQQQDQLLNYIELNDFKSKLEQFKNKNGFPKVGFLHDQLKNLASWRQAAINTVCIIDELNPKASKKLFKYLKEQQLPYQILPTYNQLINMLAASGFPADRFAIQYFPTSFNETCVLRKPMKMTVALILNSNRLNQCILSVQNVYGKNQLIYAQDEKGKLLYRGEVGECKFQSLKTGIIRVAISPCLPSFNEQVNQEKNKISQLLGESMHEKTNFVRAQMIAQELQLLKRRKQKKEVVLQSLIKELLETVNNDEKVSKIVSELTSFSRQQSKQLVQMTKARTIKDYIGLQKFSKRN